MKTQKISVILPVFNDEINLNVAIESILNQTIQNLELIIVDDGSKDNTFKIIESYAKIDKRIKVIKNSKTIGITHSLILAIRQCESDFIARQDVDVISLPTR